MNYSVVSVIIVLEVVQIANICLFLVRGGIDVEFHRSANDEIPCRPAIVTAVTNLLQFPCASIFILSIFSIFPVSVITLQSQHNEFYLHCLSQGPCELTQARNAAVEDNRGKDRGREPFREGKRRTIRSFPRVLDTKGNESSVPRSVVALECHRSF